MELKTIIQMRMFRGSDLCKQICILTKILDLEQICPMSMGMLIAETVRLSISVVEVYLYTIGVNGHM